MNANNETVIEAGTVTTVECSTTPTGGNRKTDSVDTVLTLDWSGLTVAQLIALAQKQVVIDWQTCRKEGSIPTADTVDVLDNLTATRTRKPADAGKMIAKMDPDAARAFLLEQLAKLNG